MRIATASTTRGLAALVGALLAVGWLSGCSGADDDPPVANDEPGLDPRFEALAAAIESDIADNNATAASVAVWLDGEVVWVGGFGDLGAGRNPVDERTLFMIGSDTKKCTAIALLRQVERGAATADTTIGDVLPDLEMRLATDFTGATIHELLSHQGGLVDGVETTTETEDARLRTFVYGELANSYYPLAPPGRIWNYSNPNFSVAGLLDEQLDGRAWADIVEDDVFAPLGMARTVARKAEVDDNYAPGVGITAMDDTTIGPVSLDETWESAFARPAGLVWSTPSDQMRLAAFLVDGDESVLSDELRQEVARAQVPVYPDLPGSYGYGLMVAAGAKLRGHWYDAPVWSHGGNTLTHTSTFYVLPEQRFAISILSNGQGDNFSESVATAIESLLELPPPGQAPATPFDPDGLDALVGTYVDEFNAGELIISRVGNALRIDAPLLDQYAVPYQHAMTPVSTRVWLVNIQETDLDFSFVDGPDGETYFRNRGLVGIRPAPAMPRGRVPQRPTPTPAPDEATLRAALRQAALDPIPPLLRPSSLAH